MLITGVVTPWARPRWEFPETWNPQPGFSGKHPYNIIWFNFRQHVVFFNQGCLRHLAQKTSLLYHFYMFHYFAIQYRFYDFCTLTNKKHDVSVTGVLHRRELVLFG